MTDPNLVAEAVRELYGSAAEDFVAIRKAWVVKAKAAKDREAAATIGALRKPTRSAGLLNQLAQAEPTAIDDLLQLGAELRRAQRTADAPRLKELTARRRALVGELTRMLGRFGDDISPAVRDEVVATLGAALVDDAVAVGLRSGTLTKAGSWDGFGPEVSAQLSVVRTPAARPSTVADTEEPHQDAVPPRAGLRLVTDDETAPDHTAPDQPVEVEPVEVEPEDEEPELSDRQLRDLTRAEARRQTREEEQHRREAARADLVSLEERQTAQRAERAEEARADARRRLDQAVSAHQLAVSGLDDIVAEIERVTRTLADLQQDRDDQEELTARSERAVTRARDELDRLTRAD